jgi:hypothetical protein
MMRRSPNRVAKANQTVTPPINPPGKIAKPAQLATQTDHRDHSALSSRWLQTSNAGWLLLLLASCLLGSLAAARPAGPAQQAAVPSESPRSADGLASSGTGLAPGGTGLPTSGNLAAADARIRAMDQEQLFELRRKRDTFYSLPPGRQDELRKLYAAIDEHPQRDRLLLVLQRFYSWYRELDPIVQPKILDETDLDKRIAIIQDLLREQSRDTNILPFSNRDLELVEKWVDEFSASRREELKKTGKELAQSSSDNPGIDAMVRMMFRGDIAPDALFRRLINFAFAPGRNNLEVLALVKDDDLKQLYSSLSPEGQTHVPEGREPQLQLLWTLVRRPYASDEDLHKFYVQELTPAQRDQLDRMSPERMNRELRQLYIQKKYQLPGRRGGGSGLQPNNPRN